MPVSQLGHAVAELGSKVGASVYPSTSNSIIAEHLTKIATALGLGFTFLPPFPTGLLNAIYYWLKAAYENQKANAI